MSEAEKVITPRTSRALVRPKTFFAVLLVVLICVACFYGGAIKDIVVNAWLDSKGRSNLLVILVILILIVGRLYRLLTGAMFNKHSDPQK